MGYIYVKNKKGTADKRLPDNSESWKDFWINHSERDFYECGNLNCVNDADLGGHVIKSREGGKEFILPLCYECNKLDGEEFRADEEDLISVK